MKMMDRSLKIFGNLYSALILPRSFFMKWLICTFLFESVHIWHTVFEEKKKKMTKYFSYKNIKDVAEERDFIESNHNIYLLFPQFGIYGSATRDFFLFLCLNAFFFWVEIWIMNDSLWIFHLMLVSFYTSMMFASRKVELIFEHSSTISPLSVTICNTFHMCWLFSSNRVDSFNHSSPWHAYYLGHHFFNNIKLRLWMNFNKKIWKQKPTQSHLVSIIRLLN